MKLKAISYLFLMLMFGVILACSNNLGKDITAFSINGVAGTINGISITVALPAGTVVTSLTPTITASERASVSPASGAAQDFTAPIIYTVTAANNSTKQYVVMVTTGSVEPPVPSDLCSSSTHPTDTFESGTGTVTDPYVICTATQLNLIGDPTRPTLLAKAYKLGVNINMSGVNFNIIGSGDLGFTGVFDGNGKKISNLDIEIAEDLAGFISYLSTGGVVKNLGLENITVSGNNDTGGLVGYSRFGVVSSCYVIGTISGANNTGGLIGYSSYTTISDSYTTGSVIGGDYVGGLIGGAMSTGLINNAYSASNITGGDNTGGLVGYSSIPVISSVTIGQINGLGDYIGGLIGYSENNVYNSHSTSIVYSSDMGARDVGGLVGHQDSSEIASCYATGIVAVQILESSAQNTGGLVGYNGGYVYNSYATGEVIGNVNVGGLVGDNNSSSSNLADSYAIGQVNGNSSTSGGLVGNDVSGASCYNCYYNSDNAGQASSGCGDGGVGKTTAEMTTQPTTIYTDWDFLFVWSFDHAKCSSYPSSPDPYQYPCLRDYSMPLCFTGDTLITLADGNKKRIDQIKGSDKLKSFDEDTKTSTSVVGNVTVKNANKYLVIKTSDNSTVKVTPEHPFYTGESMKVKPGHGNKYAGFKPIKNFKVGESLYVDRNGKLAKVNITSITESSEKVKVYNLHNESGPHTFFANDFAVHNK